MALIDAVQARLSAAVLKSISNPDDSGQSTVNLTLLAECVKSTKAKFATRTGMTFDDVTPNEDHLELGVAGVLYYLHAWQGLPILDLDRERRVWEEQLYAYSVAAVGGSENWVAPATDSTLTPSTSSASVQRPFSDPDNFRDIVPRDPSSGGSWGQEDHS